MDKKSILSLLKNLSCDDTQFVLHNWKDEEIFFNVSLTNEYSETVEIVLSKTSGILYVEGHITFKMLETINTIDLFLKSVFHAEYRKGTNI